MIFLILPVWWVPCVLVPIVPVLSLVPWWCTLCHPPKRGATRKDTRIERKKTTGEQHSNMKKTRFKSELLFFHILFQCFSLKEIFSKHAQHCAYTLLLKTQKNHHVSSESHLQLQLPPGRLFQTASCWVPSWAPMRRHHLYGVGPGSRVMSPNFDVSSLRDFEQGNHIR